MPYETHIVDMGKGVHKIGHGVVTSADIISSSLQRSIDVAKSGQNPVKYALLDFSGTTEFRVARDTVMQVLEIDRKIASYSTGCFVAAVAPDSLIFGMARIWSGLTKELGWESQVFYDRESAKTWLRTKLGDGNPDNCSLDEYPSLRPEGTSSGHETTRPPGN
jgi:hypothetical protein